MNMPTSYGLSSFTQLEPLNRSICPDAAAVITTSTMSSIVATRPAS
jgi:hypothetical protein